MKYSYLTFVIYILHSYICLSGCDEGGGTGIVAFHLTDARNPNFDLKEFQNKNVANNEAPFFEPEKNFGVFSTTDDDVGKKKNLPPVKEIDFISTITSKHGGVDEFVLEEGHIYYDMTRPQLTKRSPEPLPYSIQKAPLKSKITKHNLSSEPKGYPRYHSEQFHKYGRFDFDEPIITSPQSSYSDLQTNSNHRLFYSSYDEFPIFENLGPNFYGLEKNIALSNGRYIPVSSKKTSGVPYGEPLKSNVYAEDEEKSKITFTDLLRVNDEVSPSIELSDEEKDLENILSQLAKTEDSLVINKETLKKSETLKSLVQDKPEVESSPDAPNSTFKHSKLEDILDNTKPNDIIGKQLQNTQTLDEQLKKLNLKDSEEIAKKKITSKEFVKSESSDSKTVKSEVNFRILKSRNNEDALESSPKLPETKLEHDFNIKNTSDDEHLKSQEISAKIKIDSLELAEENKEKETKETASKLEKIIILEKEIKLKNLETKDLTSESTLKLQSSEIQMESKGTSEEKSLFQTINSNTTSNNSTNAIGEDDLDEINVTEHKQEDGHNIRVIKTGKALLSSTSIVGFPLPILSVNSSVESSANLTQLPQLDLSSTNISSSETFFVRKRAEVDLGEFGDTGKVNKTAVTETFSQGIINITASVEDGSIPSPKLSNDSAFVTKTEVDSSEEGDEKIVDLLFSPLFRQSVAEINPSSDNLSDEESAVTFPDMLPTNSSVANVTKVAGDVSSTAATLSELVTEDSEEKVLEFDSKEDKLSGISFVRNISKETEALHSYIRSLPPVPPILKKHFIKLKQLAASSLEKLITSEENNSEFEVPLRVATKANLPQIKFDNDSAEISDDEATKNLFQLSEEDMSESMPRKGAFEVSSELRTSKQLSKSTKLPELKSNCNQRTVWITTDVTSLVTSTLLDFATETIFRSVQLSITSFVTETKTKTSYQTIFQSPETVTLTTTVGFTTEVIEPRKIQIVVTENPIHVLTNVHLKRFTQIYTDTSKIHVVDLISTTFVELTQFSQTTVVETHYQTTEILALNEVTEFVTITILKPSPLFYTVTTDVHETGFLTVTKTAILTEYTTVPTNSASVNKHVDSTTVVTLTQYSTICDQKYRSQSLVDKEQL